MAVRNIFASDNGEQSDVAVIISLYNYEKYIVEAMDSVTAQTLESLELIVCDDCSTDNGPNLVAQWMGQHTDRFCRLMLVRNEVNSGLPATRNASLTMVSAPYTFVLDADNFIFPHCLAKLRSILEEAPHEAAFAYSQRLVFDEDDPSGCRLENLPDWDPLRLWFGNYIDAMVLHRTSALHAMHGYTIDPPFDRVGWEDYELTMRYALRGWYGIKAHQPLMAYRKHKSSMVDSIHKADNNPMLFNSMWARFPELYADDCYAQTLRRK